MQPSDVGAGASGRRVTVVSTRSPQSMGATKGRDGAAGVESPSVEHEEPGQERGVSSSGVRDVEAQRETTPAPPNSSDEWASLPSARPTSVPDFDVAALAFETSLRHPPLPALPLDIAVPTRTRAEVPAGLELRTAFLLLHVDGRSSVRDIADLTVMPVEEVVAVFRGLAELGLIDLAGMQPARSAVPMSSERDKLAVPNDDTPRYLDDAVLGPDDETLR